MQMTYQKHGADCRARDLGNHICEPFDKGGVACHNSWQRDSRVQVTSRYVFSHIHCRDREMSRAADDPVGKCR